LYKKVGHRYFLLYFYERLDYKYFVCLQQFVANFISDAGSVTFFSNIVVVTESNNGSSNVSPLTLNILLGILQFLQGRQQSFVKVSPPDAVYPLTSKFG
jgi:hypothetical protein